MFANMNRLFCKGCHHESDDCPFATISESGNVQNDQVAQSKGVFKFVSITSKLKQHSNIVVSVSYEILSNVRLLHFWQKTPAPNKFCISFMFLPWKWKMIASQIRQNETTNENKQMTLMDLILWTLLDWKPTVSVQKTANLFLGLNKRPTNMNVHNNLSCKTKRTEELIHSHSQIPWFFIPLSVCCCKRTSFAEVFFFWHILALCSPCQGEGKVICSLIFSPESWSDINGTIFQRLLWNRSKSLNVLLHTTWR